MSDQSMDSLTMTQEEKEQFIRFNYLLEEIKDVNASIEQIKKQIQLFNDANDEGMLVDDEEGNLLMACGNLFVSMDYDSVSERITSSIEDGEKELDKLKEEKATMEEELNDIKKKLYARFGDLVALG